MKYGIVVMKWGGVIMNRFSYTITIFSYFPRLSIMSPFGLSFSAYDYELVCLHNYHFLIFPKFGKHASEGRQKPVSSRLIARLHKGLHNIEAQGACSHSHIGWRIAK